MVPREGARDRGALGGRPLLNEPSPLFSVVVPSRGDPNRLLPLLHALAQQTLPASLRDVVIVFDGAKPASGIQESLDRARFRAVVLRERRGPGAARNAGALEARGAWLAFTEDDCIPERDWLERAAARIDAGDSIDVLEGATLLPNGRPARRRHAGQPTWLPTNLFVRRDLFERIGGYCEGFFDPRSGVYFREDSDLGFALAESGAKIRVDETIRVTHPREHPSWLDPIRWARRYQMDPLLSARHSESFRDEIEVLRLGPLQIRRPFVRASAGYVLTLVAAIIAILVGEGAMASGFLVAAGVLALVIWGKWRWDPRKLPGALIAPFVLLASLFQGRAWARAHGRVASRITR
ncbi:MAG TPA: glycosyltransferase [Candidatus Eisenbacteria bacterium]|nr:glycosyltransferase [Candidatus Eisenbacteria bacterium]